MLTKLRSRKPQAVVAGVVVVALVAAGAVGLFNAIFTDDASPTPPEQSQGQPPNAPANPEPAPDLDALGNPPDQIEYEDVQENCETGECYRVVGFTADGLDGADAVETIYNHLLDQDWGQADPGGREPSDVPASETILTDGTVMIQGSAEPHVDASESDGFLILAHAADPDQ